MLKTFNHFVVAIILSFNISSIFAQSVTWQQIDTLPEPRYMFYSFIDSNKLYILGGVNYPANVDGKCNYAEIINPTTFGPWVSLTPLETDLYQFGGGFNSESGYVYAAGGRTHWYPRTQVQYSKILSDGSLSPWQFTLSLPQGLNTQGSLIYNNRFYQFGGVNQFSIGTTDSVIYSNINSDGTLVGWINTTALPIHVGGGVVLNRNNIVYYIGGFNHTYQSLNSVYFSSINVDGSIGPWIETTPLPESLSYAGGFIYGDFIFILGGINSGSVSSNKIYRCTMLPDGSLSNWIYFGQLPEALYEFEIILSSSGVYLLGGESGSQVSDKIYFSDIENFSTSNFQLSVNVSDGWNMVSIPGLHPIDQNVNTWWQYRDPGANVFKYAGGYQSVTEAVPGIGYWMKHAGDRTYNTGDEWPAGGINIVPHDPISGASGWNLFGGYEIAATAANVTTNPPGLQSGPIYAYSGGYQVATTLNPGYGYWIKLTGAGQIIIPETLAKDGKPVEYFSEDWGRIILTDATGINYTLYAVKGEIDLSQYELPPAPPAGMFDIRYESGRIAEDINSSIKGIEMRGVTYPLTVRAEGMDIRLMDETGKIVNTNLKAGESVEISEPMMKLMVSGDLLPTVYSLEQNYPNPFNPSTVIEFSLPEDVSNVKLSIYNALGEKLAELVNTSLQAGRYQYQWNARNVATGMYICELRTNKYVFFKKMLLLK